jgi:hypothetical protein
VAVTGKGSFLIVFVISFYHPREMMQLIMIKMLFKKPKITVCVCLEAEGRQFYRAVKSMVQNNFKGVDVRGTACTGGCCCRSVEEENASFSIALMGDGRFGYVLRRLKFHDMEAVAAFVRAYQAVRTGMLTPKKGGIAEELRLHIATRMPILK